MKKQKNIFFALVAVALVLLFSFATHAVYSGKMPFGAASILTDFDIGNNIIPDAPAPTIKEDIYIPDDEVDIPDAAPEEEYVIDDGKEDIQSAKNPSEGDVINNSSSGDTVHVGITILPPPKD